MMRTDRTVTELFAKHGERLERRARRILGSDTEAEDAVQEVMLAILEAPHVLPSVESVLGWLYTLVRRRCVDIIRKDVRRKLREEAVAGMEMLFEGSPDPAALMEQEEVVRLVAQAVGDLPEAQRYAFVTNTMEGKTFREMSRVSGVPMGTLMARKMRAIEAIRRRLTHQGLLPSRDLEGISTGGDHAST